MALGLCRSKALSCNDATYINLFALKDYNAQGDVGLGRDFLNEHGFPPDLHPEGDDKFHLLNIRLTIVSLFRNSRTSRTNLFRSLSRNEDIFILPCRPCD
uniref:Uncharacterized protein n=1 Tax=Bionectria ochroleuca TaxID=29856 RepID=A0A8H7ND28_BIOOC